METMTALVQWLNGIVLGSTNAGVDFRARAFS